MKRRTRRVTSEMNVVPYIDVMLVLLVIFMIAAPLMTRSITVELPEVGTENSEKIDPNKEMKKIAQLEIDKDGKAKLVIGREAVADNDASILAELKKFKEENPEEGVYICGDKKAEYEKIFHFVELAKEAGIKMQLDARERTTD
ncbi:MAG: biopolymer transporter ExbD [Cardiobacteriaceae bacterium]|nr:biopolymer transporter ExbD [Cardiobacteriaceae bacterium]